MPDCSKKKCCIFNEKEILAVFYWWRQSMALIKLCIFIFYPIEKREREQ